MNKINNNDFYNKYGTKENWDCLKEEEKLHPNKVIRSSHHRIIEDLEQRLQKTNSDRLIIPEYEYDINKHHHEADLLCINTKQNYAYVIEVKSSNRHYDKMMWQLRADVEYIKQNYKIPDNRIHMFSAIGCYHNYDIKLEK